LAIGILMLIVTKVKYVSQLVVLNVSVTLTEWSVNGENSIILMPCFWGGIGTTVLEHRELFTQAV